MGTIAVFHGEMYHFWTIAQEQMLLKKVAIIMSQIPPKVRLPKIGR